jgi:glycosyltransferase involved in cell wall biosynthesis
MKVSVVIPTRNRPDLLTRALRSVWSQTFTDFEVIVVVDGPDEATCAMLAAETDHRLRVIVNDQPRTAAAARNVGVAHAKADWIAFLDDDDVWAADKLKRQLAAAGDDPSILVSCRSRIITPVACYVWPSILFEGETPLDEYLFVRRRAVSGDSFIQTSSHLVARSVALAWPFRTNTPHDDWDFILRATKRGHVRIRMLEDVLVHVYMEEVRPSLSRAKGWAASLQWLDHNRDLFTYRGYAGFCLGVVGPRAAHEGGDAASFYLLLRQAFRFGAPNLLQVITYFAFWGTSQKMRRRLRALVSAQHASRRSGSRYRLFRQGAPNDATGHT